MQEQRKAVLIRPPMHCHWGATDECLRNGRLTRLSTSYQTCFIQTKAQVELEQSIYVKLWLPDDFVRDWQLIAHHIVLRGKVIRYLAKVGFGLRFSELSTGEVQMLDMLINYLHARGDDESQS